MCDRGGQESNLQSDPSLRQNFLSPPVVGSVGREEVDKGPYAPTVLAMEDPSWEPTEPAAGAELPYRKRREPCG